MSQTGFLPAETENVHSQISNMLLHTLWSEVAVRVESDKSIQNIQNNGVSAALKSQRKEQAKSQQDN